MNINELNFIFRAADIDFHDTQKDTQKLLSRNEKIILGLLNKNPKATAENYLHIEKVGEKVGEKVTENQHKILRFIFKNPHISAKQLSALVGISSRKIEENIAKLKYKGLLQRVGSARGGYWKVIDETKK